MAKKVTRYEEQHSRNIERQSVKVASIFDDLAKEAGRIGWAARNTTEPFTFNKNKASLISVKKAVRESLSRVEKSVLSAVEVEWSLSNKKNDDIALSVASQHTEVLRQLLGRNTEALEAFQKRKIDGITLSDRVWRLEDKVLSEIEASIDVALKSGTSAAQLSRLVRQYMVEPDKLFRRVRDERGALQLSKNAKLFHPGQGVYRSSRANALRLARTEVNMAYRTADNVRWDDMDFIRGYEVKRSNNPYPCPICEALKGTYPKEFVFLGWHPNCRCYTVPVLGDADEFITRELLKLEGKEPPPFSAKEIPMPDNFISYVQNNSASLLNSADNGAEPYYLKINKEFLSKQGIWVG